MTISQELKVFEESLISKIDKKIDQAKTELLGQIDMKSVESEKRLLGHIDNKFAESSRDLNKQLNFHEKRVLDKLEDKFEERQKELRNDNLNYKDEIITEVRGLRQEVTITSGRVTRLEKPFLTN